MGVAGAQSFYCRGQKQFFGPVHKLSDSSSGNLTPLQNESEAVAYKWHLKQQWQFKKQLDFSAALKLWENYAAYLNYLCEKYIMKCTLSPVMPPKDLY